LVSLLNFGTFE
jgi:hypothetical protein